MTANSARRWHIHPHDSDSIASFARSINVPPLVAVLLSVRGLDHPDAARIFLDAPLNGMHDPSLLPGAEEAADRILHAIQHKKNIVIYGDYDADGVCGTSLLWHALRLAGADVHYYVPHRLEEGYGLNPDALRQLAEDKTDLIITVDCGIASVREAELAKELGLELIVTDHHNFASELPQASTLVHPRLPNSAYPFPEPSGSGVAFKLAWALGQRMSTTRKVSDAMREFLLGAMALAALGTVADVVPLVDENRILVRHGLRSLQSHSNPGLQALLKVTDISKKPSLTSEDIGFTLAPRINAVGRLGQAKLAVELFTSASTQRAKQLAEHLHEQNRLRQQVERRISQQARKLAEPYLENNDPALVLCSADWHAGVIGIVASRLVDRCHRPVILLSTASGTLAQGSGRSIEGLDLHASLKSCHDLLETYGGHAAAAGLKLKPENIPSFREQFCADVQQRLSSNPVESQLNIDAEIPLNLLTFQAVKEMESLAPFGAGNPRPLLAASDVELIAPPKVIGKSGQHLSLQLSQNNAKLRAVAFGKADEFESLKNIWTQGSCPTRLSIAFSPLINTFAGRTQVEIQVKDWRLESKN